MVGSLRALARRFLRDETGQDLIEYALLTTFIGFAGILAWTLVGNAISGTYTSWVNGVDSLTVPAAPSGS